MNRNKLVTIGYETIPAIGLCIGFEKRWSDDEIPDNNTGPEILLLLPFFALKLELHFLRKKAKRELN